MPVNRRAVALGPFLAAAAVLGLVAPAFAAIWQVGPGCELTRIQEALDTAAPGDRVEVHTGRYDENLLIETPVELIGLGRPEIVGCGKDDVVNILADGVTFTGFLVSRSGKDMMISDAGIKINGDHAQVLDNQLTDNLFGIYLRGCEHALVEGNTIVGRPEIAVGSRGAGIHFFDANHNTVRANEVSFVRDGCYFDHADFNVVEDNEFHHLRYGVHYMYCDDNSFYRNVFRDSVAGVAIMYTMRVTFSDNQILNNREGYHAFGLLFKDAEDCVAERNVIVNNVSGIFIEGSHRNRFANNLVAFNDVGVKFFASSLDNVFTDNDFIGNIATLHTVGRALAEWAPGGRGNYYAAYDGYDLDRDGRGDIPYRLQDAFEYLEGNRPALRLFLSSAAADALATAEKVFPLVPSSEQNDPAPAMQPVSGMKVSRISDSSWGPERSGTTTIISALSLLLACWLVWRLAR